MIYCYPNIIFHNWNLDHLHPTTTCEATRKIKQKNCNSPKILTNTLYECAWILWTTQVQFSLTVLYHRSLLLCTLWLQIWWTVFQCTAHYIQKSLWIEIFSLCLPPDISWISYYPFFLVLYCRLQIPIFPAQIFYD